MSYHILHLTTPDCYIYVDRGLLFCKYKNEETKCIAIDDLKAIIVATFGVSFSNNSIARLLENNVVILHCNNSYKPVGWSVPLDRVIRTKAFYNQIAQNKDFEIILWKKILKSKVLNQAACLDLTEIKHELYRLINKPLMNEANIAKQYWQNYFSLFKNNLKREHKNADAFENGCLNYGYAVISSLIYRSIIIHGLIAGLGIYHKEKYKSEPLVYDLMEPYRAFIDYYFYLFKKENNKEYEKENYQCWFKFLSNCIKNYRLKIDNISYKLIDTVDIYIEKIANSFIEYNENKIFLPELNKQYLHIDKHRNREYEE